jgi:hypothetical protein
MRALRRALSAVGSNPEGCSPALAGRTVSLGSQSKSPCDRKCNNLMAARLSGWRPFSFWGDLKLIPVSTGRTVSLGRGYRVGAAARFT